MANRRYVIPPGTVMLAHIVMADNDETIPPGICPARGCNLVGGVCRSCRPYTYSGKEEEDAVA